MYLFIYFFLFNLDTAIRISEAELGSKRSTHFRTWTESLGKFPSMHPVRVPIYRCGCMAAATLRRESYLLVRSNRG